MTKKDFLLGVGNVLTFKDNVSWAGAFGGTQFVLEEVEKGHNDNDGTVYRLHGLGVLSPWLTIEDFIDIADWNFMEKAHSRKYEDIEINHDIEKD